MRQRFRDCGAGASGHRARPGAGLSRRMLLAGAAGVLVLPAMTGALAQTPAPSGATPSSEPEGTRISEEARALLTSQPGKAVMGARTPPLVTEFVDVNASDWRRSVADMRTLLAGDPALAYAVVQAPRLDVRSVEAARVALAVLALEPARFQGFYEALAQVQGEIDGVKALNVVRAERLDHYKVFRASNQPDVTDSLSKAVELATALRVIDAPAYVIGGRVFMGYLDLARKRALIAAARACGGC